MPLQLVSIDVVGERYWGSSGKWYYLVIIDHASRFMMTTSADNPFQTVSIIQAFKDFWVSPFSCPHAILSDRDSRFTSQEWRNFILNNVGATIVHTSPYYPQGNAVNESSHRSINTMLIALDRQYKMSFPDALRHATAIHNSTPHTTTGYTPFFLLHGFEPVLPGWQSLVSEKATSASRQLAEVNQIRGRNLIREVLKSERDPQLVAKPIKVGDWIVYWLSNYEKLRDLSNNELLKYSPNWSLPAKVLELRSSTVTVQNWGTKRLRQVPLTFVRVLQGTVPVSLREINMKELLIHKSDRNLVPVDSSPMEVQEQLEVAAELVTESIESPVRQPKRSRR